MYKNCNRMIVVIFFLVFSSGGWAGLSATTVNTIKGNRPILDPDMGTTSLVAYSSFKVNGVIFNEENNERIYYIFDKSIKPNDFTIIGLSINDSLITNYFFDIDGDVYKSSSLSFDVPSATWTSYDNQSITNLNLTLNDLANASYQFPLKLKITNSNVNVESQYGDPNVSNPITITQTYLIDYQYKIKALRPFSLDSDPSCQWKALISGNWHCVASGLGARDPMYGGGYNSEYIPNQGFIPNPTGDKFPTTAFKNAKFQVVMVGNQSDYNYYSSDTTNAPVDVNDGYVTFINSKPSSPVTITAKLKSNPSIEYTYTFSVKTWVEPKNTGPINYNQAISACGVESNILTRSDFTDSPVSLEPIDSDWIFYVNYGTRGIGNLYGEWGHLNNYSSDWFSSPYWTQDRRSNWSPNAIHFFVNPGDGGYIGYKWDYEDDFPIGMRVACKN